SGIIALTDDSGAVSASILASPELAEIRAAARRDEEEESLIARCLEGDVEAFRPLVQRYQRIAFSVALRMLGSRADAEDVAQQAFVDAFAALDRFIGEGRNNAFSTWLLRIVINRAKDVLKSKKRTESPLEMDVASDCAARSGWTRGGSPAWPARIDRSRGWRACARRRHPRRWWPR